MAQEKLCAAAAAAVMSPSLSATTTALVAEKPSESSLPQPDSSIDRKVSVLWQKYWRIHGEQFRKGIDSVRIKTEIFYNIVNTCAHDEAAKAVNFPLLKDDELRGITTIAQEYGNSVGSLKLLDAERIESAGNAYKSRFKELYVVAARAELREKLREHRSGILLSENDEESFNLALEGIKEAVDALPSLGLRRIASSPDFFQCMPIKNNTLEELRAFLTHALQKKQLNVNDALEIYNRMNKLLLDQINQLSDAQKKSFAKTILHSLNVIEDIVKPLKRNTLGK